MGMAENIGYLLGIFFLIVFALVVPEINPFSESEIWGELMAVFFENLIVWLLIGAILLLAISMME